jgi:hypothetical protein
MSKLRFGRAVAFLLALALVLSAATPMLADDGDEEDLACNPMAARLAEMMGIECDEIMALHDEGVGFGQIMMAWRVSQSAPEGYGLGWEELLQLHLEGEGWGERMLAYRLSSAIDADPDDLLELKAAGLGWGQMSHAAALAAHLEVPFEDVVGEFGDDPEWDDIREAFGLPPAPPPWAGGPPAHAGRPDWAGGPERGPDDQ